MTIGLDLSDGHARAVLVTEQAEVLSRAERPIPGATLAAAASAALAEARSRVGGEVTRLAIAVAHPDHGLPPELRDIHRQVLPDLEAPTLVGAGAATVIAEQWCGAARGVSNVVALSPGEHVTSGIMLNGRVWPGAHGLAGSVGWLSLNPVEREDYRRLGGLEAEVSAGGIVRRIVWRIKSGDGSHLMQHLGDLNRITVDQVMHHARTGDGLCVSVIRDTAKYIAMAVANLAAILDPEVIVLGGLVAASGDLLLDPIRTECGRRLSPEQVERLQILVSPLGGDAAAIGAARLARPSA